MKRLEVPFKSGDKKFTFSINNVKNGITKAEVDALVLKIVGVLVPDGSVVNGDYVVVETTETTV